MKTQSIFYGFNSIKELQNYIGKFNGQDAVVANIVMGITIETINKIEANNEIKKGVVNNG